MEHFKEVPDVNRLIISPLYLREGLEFAKNQGYNDILISTDDIGISGVSCKHTLNVSLICEYDFIETLIISGYDFTIEPCNLNQLSVLPHLKKLGLWIDKVFTIDFSLFPKLEELKYYHTKQTENVDTLINLKRLHIYNLKSEDLKELKSMNLLEELTLWDAKNINLNGLCQLTNIRTLEIVRSRKMIDIRGLCNSNRLKELSLYYCNNITDISVLNRLSRVKILRLRNCKRLQDLTQLVPNNTIKQISISSLKDLKFLAGMKKLKFLHFDDVIDGDISPLLDSSLEFVGMVSKKKYSHTEKEVNLILERNRLNNKQLLTNRANAYSVPRLAIINSNAKYETENIPYHYLFTLLVLWSSLFTKSQSRYFAARPFGLV